MASMIIEIKQSAIVFDKAIQSIFILVLFIGAVNIGLLLTYPLCELRASIRKVNNLSNQNEEIVHERLIGEVFFVRFHKLQTVC